MNLQQDWAFYKRIVKKARNSPEKSSEEFQEGRNLEKLLLKIEEVVVNGKMLNHVTSLREEVP